MNELFSLHSSICGSYCHSCISSFHISYHYSDQKLIIHNTRFAFNGWLKCLQNFIFLYIYKYIIITYFYFLYFSVDHIESNNIWEHRICFLPLIFKTPQSCKCWVLSLYTNNHYVLSSLCLLRSYYHSCISSFHISYHYSDSNIIRQSARYAFYSWLKYPQNFIFLNISSLRIFIIFFISLWVILNPAPYDRVQSMCFQLIIMPSKLKKLYLSI